ncbi:MAG TPA: isoprenylcysteine carboxylmethyltransferase family protein [Polyangiaceae bacterium]|nr:isoprenylcysteine carboxylmethyltransferase family protein [Polyangiaceae bacterium]
MRFDSRFPPALFAVGAAILVGVAARELAGGRDPLQLLRAAMMACYLLWLVLEARVTFRGADEAIRHQDRSTLYVYGLARFVTVGAGVLLEPLFHAPNVVHALGALVFVAGVALRLVAIHSLGRLYSHRVRALYDHAIVSSGPYRVVRHPAYSGMLLAHVGFVAFFLNFFAALVLCVVFVPALLWRIAVEERVLMQIDGYPEYASGRKRLVPVLW